MYGVTYHIMITYTVCVSQTRLGSCDYTTQQDPKQEGKAPTGAHPKPKPTQDQARTQPEGQRTPHPKKNTPKPKHPHKPNRTNRQNQSRGDQALRAQARLSLNPDALVEPIAKGQAHPHPATGKGHIAHALVEIPSKGQALQAAGQNHFLPFSG